MAPTAPEQPGDSPRERGARRKRPIWMAAVAALVTLLAIYGLWVRESSGLKAGAEAATAPGGLFLASQAQGTPLVAVGRTAGLDRPCTAWLLETDSPERTPAYAVTAGRCVGIEDSATVLSDRELPDAKVEFRAFARVTSTAPLELVEAPIDRVVWASMRGTDLAILRLGTSYGELANRGVTPISPVDGPGDDPEILVAGVPVEGIPADQQFLRGSRCKAERTADLIEAGGTFEGFWATGCQGILPGSEGSMAFNQQGRAVGMVTTTTIGAPPGHPCTPGRPCEVDGGGAKVEADATYLAPVGGLQQCFRGGAFTLGGQCALEDPDSVVDAGPKQRSGKPGTRIGIRVAGASGPVQAVAGPVGDLSCWDRKAWEEARRTARAESGKPTGGAQVAVRDGGDVGADVTVTLPRSEGFTMVCLGSPSQPTPVVLESDGTPPDPGGIQLEQEAVEGGVRVQPVADPPELSGFRWVSGPEGSLDCASAEGYVEYSGSASVIEAANLPSTVCVVAVDEAGNASQPASIAVE